MDVLRSIVTVWENNSDIQKLFSSHTEFNENFEDFGTLFKEINEDEL